MWNNKFLKEYDVHLPYDQSSFSVSHYHNSDLQSVTHV